ncbi:MAG: hypothetical protein JXC32_19700 [Anaerolineae bacterium]|nr:hypothetical protein [Anaerolineae bacterium]
MRWFRSLTSRQRTILLALGLSVIAVVSLLVWSVWGASRAAPAVSPVAPPPVHDTGPALSVSVLPTPAVATPVTPTPTPMPSFDVSRAGVVAAEVAAARQSRNRWGTPLSLVDLTDMARAIYRHYQRWPPLVLRARPVLEALHLWFWDVLRLDVVAQSEDAAAFYVPESEELIVRRDWDGGLESLETQLAFGYARALPDQYGNLPALTNEAPTLDRKLALIAIAEGDALVSTLLYRGLEPGSPEGAAVQAEVARAICPRWQVEDALLEDLTCLAFRLGSDFAIAHYQAGGTEALDELVLRPPRSTEQLLDHERYVAFEQPVVLSPLAPEVSSRWVLTTTETLGQALMGVVLAEWGDGEALSVLDWGGDLLQVWEGPDEGRLAVWQMSWDNVRTAIQFYEGMVGTLPRPLMPPGTIRDRTAADDLPRGRWWSGTRGAAFIYRRSDTVWLIWGTDPELVEAAAAAAGEVR